MCPIDDLPPPPSKASSIDDLPPPPLEMRSSSGPSLSQQGKSAVQGFGRMASFGQLPTMQAYAEKAIERAAPENDKVKALEDQGFTIVPINKSAQDIRKEYVNYDTEQKNKAPYSYLGGEIGGGTAAGIATGGAVLAPQASAALGSYSPMAQAILGGAAQGAFNAGPKEFETGEFNPKERAQNALTGAEYGVGGHIAGAAIQKAAQALPELAQSSAFKSLGPYVKQVRDTFNKDIPGDLGDEARQIGQFALDNKIVTMGDTVNSIYSKANIVKQELGQKIGQAYDQALAIGESQGNALAFNPKQLGKEFLDDFSQSMRGKAGGDQSINAVKQEVKNFMQMPAQANIKDIHDFRADLDNLIYDARANKNTPAAKALLTFRGYLTDKINENISQVSQYAGQELGSELQDLNRQYSLAASATSIAKNKVIHETAKNMLGLRDTGLGATAAILTERVTHNPVEAIGVGTAVALGTMGASKLAGKFGTPVLARSLQGSGYAAGKATDLLEQLSPAQLGAVSSQIQNIKQSTPFQRRMEGRK